MQRLVFIFEKAENGGYLVTQQGKGGQLPFSGLKKAERGILNIVSRLRPLSLETEFTMVWEFEDDNS